MSTLGYYKDPYSDEERSRRLYKEGLKHKAKEENYQPFGELGYALEKKRAARKAIGAYNSPSRINPRYYLAWRYREEALIKLGLIKDTRDS